ncbi:MAG: hypothetical protein EXS38_06105 [Opitutus sp.]|nr:hypothetical protein [Opitutus sp.]
MVGYATIVWSIFGPFVFVGSKSWTERHLYSGAPATTVALAVAALLVGGLFLLAFFTVHFGMFHYVHSVFLQSFFPVNAGEPVRGAPPASLYFEVVRRYWVFLPAAFLAERQGFRFNPAPPEPPDTSVKAADIAARKARNARKSNLTGMMAPYKNVIRMHLLIFFFAAAHFAKLDNFAVYAVVYAVYFFPWRMLRKDPAVVASGA